MLNRNFTTVFCGLLWLIAFPNWVNAQKYEEIQADSSYIWGIGVGTTLKAADQAALADIIGQISTQVESNFERTVTETGDKFKETVNDVVKTYSNATLNNTGRLIIEPNEPSIKVFRFIKRGEISKIFELRKNKIIELAHNGEMALKNLQIADALRYFYWSQTLLRSHPSSSEIKMKCEAGTEELLITWIPLQINQIFINISVKMDTVEIKENYSNYVLEIKYKNEPVRNFDYTYWGGQDWSNIISGKDGIGVVELPKSESATEIRLKAEYAFENEASIDMELRDVIQKLPQVPYKDSYINVSKSLKPKPLVTVAAKNEKEKSVNATGTVHALADSIIGPDIMKNIVNAITIKNYASVKPLFTEDGYAIFQSLLQYGNAKIVKSFDLKYFRYGDYVICRSIPMSFSFKTNNRIFIEDVIFYFDKDKKVCNLTFGLSKKAVEDIASNNTWSEDNRILLMCFLENYKTAFTLKRFDYIDKIFADDALIITGLVTKVNTSSDSRYANNTIIKYNRQTKDEYLKKLKYSFASNEFINIRFTDNTVRRSGKGNEVYGIQIKQDYFSTNYGDTGYLFLLVDLSDTLKPQIHVRTWQPEKNPDGSIYGVGDF